MRSLHRIPPELVFDSLGAITAPGHKRRASTWPGSIEKQAGQAISPKQAARSAAEKESKRNFAKEAGEDGRKLAQKGGGFATGSQTNAIPESDLAQDRLGKATVYRTKQEEIDIMKEWQVKKRRGAVSLGRPIMPEPQAHTGSQRWRA